VTVTVEALSMNKQDLQAEVLCLRQRVRKSRAIVRIQFAVLRALNIHLDRRRLPGGEANSILPSSPE